MFFNFVVFAIVFLVILLSITLFVLIERKTMGFIQSRKGPNVVGFVGLLQSFADGGKLFLKLFILPEYIDIFFFLISPFFIFIIQFFLWYLLSFNVFFLSISMFFLSVLVFFGISSLSVYGIVLSSWTSRSKYSIMASLRSLAQMISYEISFSLIISFFLFNSYSLDIIDLIFSNFYFNLFFTCFYSLIFFFIIVLAETNRAPFDLAEAEAELVAGYNVEYSSIGFVLFYLAEYSSMLFLSIFISVFFFNNLNSLIFIFIKIFLLLFIYGWVRAAYPRLRYDQLMTLNWQVLILIFSFILFFFILCNFYF